MSDVLRKAAQHAIGVLSVIRDADAESGIKDPDVIGAIRKLKAALDGREDEEPVEPKPVTKTRLGLKRGDPIEIIDGPKAGQRGTYAGMNNSDWMYVKIAGKKQSVHARLVRRLHDTTENHSDMQA